MGGEKENGIICYQKVASCLPTERTAYRGLFSPVPFSFLKTPLLPALSVFTKELL